AELRAALRAEPRVQLRTSAQQWHDLARPPGLLWGRDVLSEFERRAGPDAATKLSPLECSFVAESTRRARRSRWVRRTVVAVAAVAAIVVFLYRSATQARIAEQQGGLAKQQARLAEQESRAARELAETKITDSELEQGRAALLHGEPEALVHLAEAYK